MIKRLVVYPAILIIAFSAVSCAKKEEKQKAGSSAQIPAQQGQEGTYGGPGLPGPGMTQGSATDPHGTGSAGKEAVVSVPDFVKGKWRGVVLTIEDKKNNKKKDYEVKLNSEFTIPDSNIVIKTGEFLPSFTMDDKAYTSRSNNPDNPGVNVTITEGGKVIFKSWIFSKFPTMHPFMHNRFGIALKEGVKAS